MRLSREAIQRMVGDRVGGGGGAGGGGGISMDDIQGMGFATEQWVNENFVGIPFWNLLFKIYGKQTTTVDGEVTDEQDITFAPNTMPSRTETTEGGVTTVVETTITRIEALFDFNSVGGVSALGYNPEGGGGGGADLNALLASINTSAIGSTAPGASNVGKCLVWTADGWAWGTTGSGGGGTVTAITAGTGLSGGTITTSGTIALSQDTLTAIASGVTAYSWGDHAQAGYLTSSALTGYATEQWVNQQGFLTSSAISDMATKTWVEDQGYVTSSGVTSVGLSMPTGFSVSGSPVTTSGTLSVGIATGYFIPTTTQRTTWNGKQDAISDLSTIRSGAAAGATAVQPSAISDMATQTWVGQQGFLTSSAISDMATKTWVEDQGYVTSSGVTSVGLSMPTGFSVSGSPVTTSGTLSVGIATGYFIPTTTQRTTWNGKQDAISDLSTIRSGAAAGATAVQPSAISDMATQTWVGQQGFITASALSSYLPLTGGTLTGALHMGSAAGASPYIYWGDGSYAYIGEDSDDHITLRGDKGVNILTGSSYELEWNGNTLATQEWINSQGYMLRTEGMRFTDYGSYIAARFVLADGSYDAARSGKAQGSGFIEWWSTGGYFNHHVGNVKIGEGSSDGDCYLQIGGGRIYWDSTNNALYVKNSSGSSCHFYATGGVSALGMSGGGSPSIDNLEVVDLSIGNTLNLNGNSIYMDGGDITDAYTIYSNQLRVGNGSVISKIYWNGTYLQVKIGSTTYNFRPV